MCYFASKLPLLCIIYSRKWCLLYGAVRCKGCPPLLWKLFLCNLYQGAFGMVNEFFISVTDKTFVGGFVQELNNITSRLHHNCVTLLSHDCITEHRNHIVSAPYHYIDLHKLFHHNWVILHPHCISTSMSISIAI